MQGSETFSVSIPDFMKLDKFLDKVDGNLNRVYPFDGPRSLKCILRALGFSDMKWNGRPKPVLIYVSPDIYYYVIYSSIWSFVSVTANDMLGVQWKSPEPMHLTAQQAHEMADKTTELDAVLQKVKEGAAIKQYSLTVDKCSDETVKQLAALGYQLKILENSAGLFISSE